MRSYVSNEPDGWPASGSQQPRARPLPFRVVQPYGRDKARESTFLSEHATAAEAFAEIDRLSLEMVRLGAPSDAIELLVLDAERRIVPRPSTN